VVTERRPIQLGALQREAAAADARTREVELLARQTDLRLRSIDVERLRRSAPSGSRSTRLMRRPRRSPSLTGQPAFAAPRFTYDASLRVDQRLYDASIQPRRDLARADLAESQSRVRTALFALRQEVNDAFFGAALLQEQLAALTATLDDLEGRLTEMTRRVREEARCQGRRRLEATLLQQRQQADALRSSRRAALARLAILTGRAIEPDAAVVLPELTDRLSQARENARHPHPAGIRAVRSRARESRASAGPWRRPPIARSSRPSRAATDGRDWNMPGSP